MKVQTVVLFAALVIAACAASAVSGREASDSAPALIAERVHMFQKEKMVAARATQRVHQDPPAGKSEEAGAAGEGGEAEGGNTGGDTPPTVSKGNQKCVICQYFVQRIRAEMKLHGFHGGVPFGNSPPIAGETQGALPPSAPTAGRSRRGGAAGEAAPPAGETPPPAGEEAPPAGGSFLELNQEPASGAPQDLANRNGVYVQRDRDARMLRYKPNQVRYANIYDGPARAARRAQERFQNNQIYSLVFDTMQGICHHNMPKMFFEDCGAVLAKYQEITEGLRGEDRPDSICMAHGFCDQYSYIRKGPHAVESSE